MQEGARHVNAVGNDTGGGVDLYKICVTSRRMCTSQCYSLQTSPLFGHPTPPPSSHTLLRNIVFYSIPLLLQYIPYNMVDDNIV